MDASGAHTELGVLMTADTIGGIWTYSLELAAALAPHGVRVSLATMGRPVSGVQRRAAEEAGICSVIDSSFRLEWMEDPWLDVQRAGEWLLDLEDKLRPDIVHINGYTHAALQWQAPVLVAAHSCVLSWWMAVHGVPAPPRWDSYRIAVRRGLAGATAVVAPTLDMLRSLELCYGISVPGSVIWNGRATRAPDGAGKDPFIFAAGRVWDEAKNIAALRDVAPAVSWPVYVAGDDSHPDHAGTPATDGLRLLGQLDAAAMSDWYARAAIYCLPARYEPFGLSVLEAASARCALVVGDIPSLRELWDGAAVFVAPDDHDALTNALLSMIADRGFRDAMALKAQQRAARYSPTAMAESYRALYMQIAGRPGRLMGSSSRDARCVS